MIALHNRKAQAAAAAALLAIIAALIVLYILFIPQEEREKILDGDGTDGIRNLSRAREKNVTLLDETPGRLDFLSQKRIEHAIPAAHLFTRTAGVALEQKDSLYVKRTLFSSLEADFPFTVADLANTENVLLSFTLAKAKGRLIIALNGEELLNREITTPNIAPLHLPPKLLKADNVLHVQASSPGAAFWRTNEFSLENVQVTADVTRTQAQRSRNVFLISQVEFNNLDRARLRFQADCDPDLAGPLDIWVNQYNVYSAVPDCGVGPVSVEFPPSYFLSGQNELIMSIERGDYLVSHVSVESQLKEIDFPVFFFDLSEEQFKSVKNSTKRVLVRLDFVDTVDRKQGSLFVNGRLTGFDTRELSAEEDISADIERGDNSVKIKPERTLDIRRLLVLLVKR